MPAIEFVLLVLAWIGVCCCTPVENLQAWLDFKENTDELERENIKSTAKNGFEKNSKFEDLERRQRPWARDVPRVRALSLEQYRDFEGRVPVVWEGAYENFQCLTDTKWVEKMMSAELSNEKVVFTAHKENDERVMSTKMKIFLKNVNQNSPKAWSYLRDEFFLRRHPDLMASCPPLIPFLQNLDQFALLPQKFIPPNATLLWGGRYSRSKLHVDPYNWTGTNVVIRGEKFFRLIPPTAKLEALEVVKRTCHMALECVSYESSTDLFEAVPQGVPLWETKLQPGDLLIIPSGWWHQAVNLGTTLAMASGLITPRSGTWSAVAEVVRFYSKVHPSWRWGKLPVPPKPEEEIAETEATRRFRRFINALPAEVFKAAEKFLKEKQEFQQRQEL